MFSPKFQVQITAEGLEEVNRMASVLVFFIV